MNVGHDTINPGLICIVALSDNGVGQRHLYFTHKILQFEWNINNGH